VAIICKEKFKAREKANFNLNDNVTDEDVKNKLNLVVLAKQSNYMYYIFNHAYARINTLMISILLH
jgi:hypothetical protein